MSSSSGNSRLLPIALVAIIALLGVAAYQYSQNSDLRKSYDNTVAKLDETETLKSEINAQYYASLAELEEMKGSNAAINAELDAAKADLMESKKRIDVLMKDKRNLAKVREELASLKELTAEYVSEINKLREENGLLAEQNMNLSSANEGLMRTVADATAANEELTSAKASLMSEKEVLVKERAELSNTVTMASVINIENIDVTGLRMKDSGKTVKKKYAKNVDLIDICFETMPNKVTQPGVEEFYVRIINPLGETLAVEEMGSGVIENVLTKEKVRYTKKAEHTYTTNSVSQVCIKWDAPNQLSKGDYGVEVYNKGYLSGQGSFTLK